MKNNLLKRIVRKIKYKLIVACDLKKQNVGNTEIKYGEKVNNLISDKLKSSGGVLITRLGTTEAEILRWHMERPKQDYPAKLTENLSTLSGVFPSEKSVVYQFCENYKEAIMSSDVFGVRAAANEQTFWEDEAYIFNNLGMNKDYFDLNAFDPFLYKNPWSAFLEGKNVLVIHPFQSSITKQYAIREKLFSNEKILPKFNLITIKAVQSLAENKSKCGYSSFFEALDSMKLEINKQDFDIALIGAGAYGILLGHHCKSLGKKAVHVGGSLQLYFGILGSRWNGSSHIQNIKNNYWVNPLEEEIPEGSKNVENGCYW